jgi:hypothetical protein
MFGIDLGEDVDLSNPEKMQESYIKKWQNNKLFLRNRSVKTKNAEPNAQKRKNK